MTDEKNAEIQKKHASLAGAWSPFDVLEIPGNATRAEARAAFLKMSKLYHPDNHFGIGRGDGIHRMLEEIFERVTWAHKTLDEMLP